MASYSKGIHFSTKNNLGIIKLLANTMLNCLINDIVLSLMRTKFLVISTYDFLDVHSVEFRYNLIHKYSKISKQKEQHMIQDSYYIFHLPIKYFESKFQLSLYCSIC